jgi:hypothetical protein
MPEISGLGGIPRLPESMVVKDDDWLYTLMVVVVGDERRTTSTNGPKHTGPSPHGSPPASLPTLSQLRFDLSTLSPDPILEMLSRGKPAMVKPLQLCAGMYGHQGCLYKSSFLRIRVHYTTYKLDQMLLGRMGQITRVVGEKAVDILARGFSKFLLEDRPRLDFQIMYS